MEVYDFPFSWIPTDEFIFFRGVAQPPTSYVSWFIPWPGFMVEYLYSFNRIQVSFLGDPCGSTTFRDLRVGNTLIKGWTARGIIPNILQEI